MTLSSEDVSRFLEDKLGITDWRVKLEKSKLGFLKQVISAHGCNVYYQNASWIAVPPVERKMPTVEEVIYHGLNSSGATCIHLNYFIKLILEHLGYDTFVLGAESPIWDIRRSHLVTGVRLEKDEIYLIDLGFGRPFLEPIPLHKLPHVAKAGGYVFEYRFNPENQNYERYSHLGCALKGKFEEDVPGKVDYYFDLTPLNFDDFTECFKAVFVGHAPFLTGLFLFRFTRWVNTKDFDYICCRNVVMIKGSVDTYEETVYDCYEEILPEVKKFFTKLDWTEMGAAIQNCNEARKSKEKSEVEG